MKNKIQEVQDYFADKLARGLYEKVKVSEHTVKVVVDNEYNFCLWMSNGSNNFETWIPGGCFMPVNFTDKQRDAGYKIAKKHHKHWTDTELRDKELAELKKLQDKYPG